MSAERVIDIGCESDRDRHIKKETNEERYIEKESRGREKDRRKVPQNKDCEMGKLKN